MGHLGLAEVALDDEPRQRSIPSDIRQTEAAAVCRHRPGGEAEGRQSHGMAVRMRSYAPAAGRRYGRRYTLKGCAPCVTRGSTAWREAAIY